MTNVLPVGGFAEPKGLTRHMALRLAWVFWVILLVIPFLLFLKVVWNLSGTTISLSVRSDTWFLSVSMYLLIAGPLSFFWRGHVWKSYYAGKPVTPGKYFFGMLAIWLALVIGGIFSLLGCIVDHNLLPNLLPALVAFMFFVTQWPHGRAMRLSTGDRNDPQVYEEPR